jgi:predicted GIY-YIG superfamily endonuclease
MVRLEATRVGHGGGGDGSGSIATVEAACERRLPIVVIAGLDPAIHAISYPPMRRSFWVYILASQMRGTLYIGVTNDIARRLFEHRNSNATTFVGRYRVFRLVHIEEFPTAAEAISARSR